MNSSRAAAGLPVAQGVETLQATDAGVEGALATLTVDVVLQVAGHRGDHFDAMRGQELRQPLLTGLLEDRQVAAVDDPHAA